MFTEYNLKSINNIKKRGKIKYLKPYPQKQLFFHHFNIFPANLFLTHFK